jgi:hypothetical protein
MISSDPSGPVFRAILHSAAFLSFTVVLHGAEPETLAFDPQALEFFERDIRPLLIERCFKCHGEIDEPEGGLKMTSRAAILQGGDTGPAAVPGNTKQSLIVEAIDYRDSLQMPPDGKLSDHEIELLSKWVNLGLPWPASAEGNTEVERPTPYEITEEQRKFWSFQPLQQTAPPAVNRTAWPKTEIDHFILAKLEERNLTVAEQADKRTLIRRATFDLTGLPPTPEEIEAFLADESQQAYANLIERLLASPAYGEHWGRHWLDVARYADAKDVRDFGEPYDIVESYRYRDWVVKAFNEDLPYDQFIRYQIAGDLIPAAQPDEVNVDAIVASGFLTIGCWGHGDADLQKMYTDMVDDQINVVSRAFLGLTISCARCHDHKFDPIPTADYYGLAGIFFSTRIADPQIGARYNKVPLVSPATVERSNKAIGDLNNKREHLKNFVNEQYAKLRKQSVAETSRYLLAAYDYRGRPPEKEELTPLEFALENHLNGDVLVHWLDELGSNGNCHLDRVSPDFEGHQGVFVWQHPAASEPLVVLNTNEMPVQLYGELPGISIGVHPGANSGVGIVWTSPIAGRVNIRGRIEHIHRACGGGVAWVLEQRGPENSTLLGGGELPRGGQQDLQTIASADKLLSLPVAVGDSICITVSPKGDSACDMTALDFEIIEHEGEGRVWKLANDLTAGLKRGETGVIGDNYGNQTVWLLVAPRLTSAGTVADSAVLNSLATEFAAANKINVSAASRIEFERLAVDLQQRLDSYQKELQDQTEKPGANSVPADSLASFYEYIASEAGPFRVENRDDKQMLPAAAQAAQREMQDEIAALETEVASMPPIPYAMACSDGGVPGTKYEGFHDAQIHIRGRYDRLGEVVPRHFPRIIAGDNQPPINQGSGRLQLAEWITRPDHPLTARVMVNRLWLHHFGQGLVRTPGNFGKLGEPPTHPELLDFLAQRFIDSGWSVKAMHRLMMQSAVYMQSTRAPADLVQLDPENRLWGRANCRRIEAEAIRDTLLFVSGQLDRTMGGPVVRDLADDATNKRRAIYLMVNRSNKTNSRSIFDGADPESIVDQRVISTVAPQSLYLLNNPFVLAQCTALAERLVREVPQSEPGRIERIYGLLYGRSPSAEERELGQAFLHIFREKNSTADNSELLAWQQYCQSLLCANELIFVD